MDEELASRPRRGFVQTPRIVAVRLGLFVALLSLALWGVVMAEGWLRALSGGFILLSAVAVGFSLYVMRRPSRPPAPTPEADRGVGAAPEEAFAAARATGKEMRVYALQTGETLVSFGQLFKGNEGWVGTRAVWNMGADEATVFWVPVHAYLIVHPQQGPVLFDTGMGRAQTEKGYYSAGKGGLAGLIWKTSDNYLPQEQELARQLGALGYEMSDVRHVIMSHLHEDHVGELNGLAEATVYVSRAEWDDRERMGYGPSYETVRAPRLFAFGSGRFYTFDASEDLFGDGSVILLPTYGHSLGHTSLVVQMGDYALCLAADALYTLRHLHPESLSAFNYFGEVGFATQQDSARRLAELQEALPEMVMIPTHDPFAYTFQLVQPFLADGRLTEEERKALRAYQAGLYDETGKLRREAMPQWEKTEDGYGQVWANIA